MNWMVRGKHAGKRLGGLRIIGGPETEAEVRESVKGSHPDFVVEKIEPLLPAPPAPAIEVKENK